MPVPQTTPRPPLVPVAEYLRLEREAVDRHEYLEGVITAMAGESGAHADISFNLAAILGTQLRGKPCRGRTKDTKVRSGPAGPRQAWDTAGLFSYPDVVIVCGQPEYFDDAETIVTNPVVIIEVLSPSTERFDRVESSTATGGGTRPSRTTFWWPRTGRGSSTTPASRKGGGC